jgi:hypothetical protein
MAKFKSKGLDRIWVRRAQSLEKKLAALPKKDRGRALGEALQKWHNEGFDYGCAWSEDRGWE